jgi:subtilisin family serine protease
MRKFKKLKINALLLILAAFTISVSGFRDSGKYTMVNERVIKRSDGALYEKGMVNIKFRQQPSAFTNRGFGIAALDNSINSFGVTEVFQRFPLKPNVEARIVGDDDLAKIFTIKYDGGIDPFELSERLLAENRDLIEWVEPSFVYEMDFIPNDPNINNQYHIAKINSFMAWDITQGDTNVVIGIVDSGSDLDHPDLAANIKINYAENPTNGLDDDGNGYVDDWRGWDFVGDGTGQDNDPNVLGANCNHGSHVSGCASQVTNNNVHGAGIGFKSKLLISKHGDDDDFSGEGGTSLIYNSDQGIAYCYQNGADVINCSFGSSFYSALSQNIINNAFNAGTIVVGTAGNSNANVIRYPGAYNNVINVAATNANDVRASFSNWHTTVDVSAPGDGINSTVFNNGYALFSGTSMAAPITAGTIALIRARYPSWTAQQVVDRLISSTDSIYSIPGNAPYINGLGTGRVNALKAVTDLPVFALQSVVYNDSVYGNNDKVFDVNEIIPIAFTVKNTWLAGSNVSLRLTTTDPNVEIVRDSVFIGNVTSYNTYNTTLTNTFQVKAKPQCPFDRSVQFKITATTGAYVDNNGSTFNIVFRQGFAVHNINNLKLALTRDGAIGKKSENYGSGLFLDNGNTNNMYESSLMIGINNTQVSDVGRRGTVPANVSDTDFVGITSYTITTPGLSSDQDGRGLFNDNGAGTGKIGVEVSARSFAYNNPIDDDYILLRYNIKNTNGTPINNMHVGLYVFFAPTGAFTGNVIGVDTLNDLGYTYNNTNNNPYLGAAMFTGQNLNFKGLAGVDVLTGFTAQEKWDALSGGVNMTMPPPGLACFVISAGPINLAAGDTTTVGFGIIKGGNLIELLANTVTARAKYFATVGITPVSENIPDRFELFQNYPNPFNPSTTIKFALPKNGLVKIKVYDMLGKEVANLVNEEVKAGTYEVKFNGAGLSSGMYFYRIETPEFTEVKKMIMIK